MTTFVGGANPGTLVSGDVVRFLNRQIRIPYLEDANLNDADKSYLLRKGYDVILRSKPLSAYFKERAEVRGWRFSSAVVAPGVQIRLQDPQYDGRAPEIINAHTKYFGGKTWDEAAEKAWVAMDFGMKDLEELSFCSHLDRLQGILEPLK